MRPKLHYTSEENWINDPNGLIYYQGEYHLFYQYFPYAPKWGTMHWGHATTKDFINYSEHKIALYPTKSADANGIFSGSSIEKDGELHIFYTGVKYEQEDPDNIHVIAQGHEFVATQMKITSKDGYGFDNFENKKVIIPAITNSELGHLTHTRDPKVWQEAGKYYLILGTKVKGEDGNYQGKVLIYQSDDLDEFTLFTTYSLAGYGDMWECPDYFKIEDQGYLIMSPENTSTRIDDYNSHPVITKANLAIKNAEFTCQIPNQLLDYGLDVYAPQTFEDQNGQRILICWIRMPEPEVDNGKKYIGMMTMPRRIIKSDNGIRYQVISEIANNFIKTENYDWEKVMKLTAVFREGNYINIGGYKLSLENQRFVANREAVFIDNEYIAKNVVTPILEKDKIQVEIYVDRNVIEIFIDNGSYVITQVVYELGNDIYTNLLDLKYAYFEG